MPGRACRKGRASTTTGRARRSASRRRLTRGHLLAVFFYEGRHVYSLDGVRANHLLQRMRADLVVPVFGPWGIGVAGEYFDRRTFFQDPDQTKKSYHYPQFRAFLTWSK